MKNIFVVATFLSLAACGGKQQVDLIVHNAVVYTVLATLLLFLVNTSPTRLLMPSTNRFFLAFTMPTLIFMDWVKCSTKPI
jgi:hypothetical protein